MDVAAKVRRGNYIAAENELQVLYTSTEDPRMQYRALLFRFELVRRRFQLAGGGLSMDDDTRLAQMSMRATKDEILKYATYYIAKAGQGEAQQVRLMKIARDAIITCLETVPSYRFVPVENEQRAKWAAEDTSEQSCRSYIASLAPSMSAASHQLLERLVSARAAVLWHDDLGKARADLRAGLEIVQANQWKTTEALWLLRLGDLEAAPRGNVLSLGYDLTIESSLRGNLTLESRSSGLDVRAGSYDRRDLSVSDAAAWYRKAKDAAAPSEIALREAIIAYRYDQPSAQLFFKAATIARKEHNSWTEVMARTSGVLMGGSNEEFKQSLEEAARQGNFGAGISISNLVESWAARTATAGGLLFADNRLRAIAATLAGQDLESTRADVLAKVAEYDSDLGRWEAGVYALDEASNELRRMLKKVQATQPPAQDAEMNERLTEGDVKFRLGLSLFSLAAHLRFLETNEGLVAWKERRERVQRETRELLSKDADAVISKLAQLEAGLPNAGALAAQLAEFRKLETCGAILNRFKQYAATTDPVVRTDALLVAGECDPSLASTARGVIAKIDPVNPVAEALLRTRKGWNPDAQLALQMSLNIAQVWLMKADSAESADILDRWVEGMEKTMAGATSVSDLAETLRYYRARAHSLRGSYREAREILLSLRRSEPFWSRRATSNFREQALHTLVAVEAALGHAEPSLVAAEEERAEQDRAQALAMDGSLEYAMRLRGAALEGSAGPSQTLVPPQNTALGQPERIGMVDALRRGLRTLPPKTTALVFHPLRNELAIWRIDSPEKVRLAKSPIRASELQRLAGRFRTALANGLDGWDEIGKQLYTHLIEPVGAIERGRTLAIVGADEIGGIPFEMVGASSKQLLLADHPVVYLSALAVEGRSSQTEKAKGEPLVAGINIAPLVTPELEARGIGKVLDTAPLIGPAATVAAVMARLPNARYVHLATHGMLDIKNTYRSYLDLADKPLEAWFLLRAAAKSDLLVLSACDTKLGPRSPMAQLTSERKSITGIASAAGVRRLVSSLWAANDTTAPNLMIEFYRQMERDPSQPALALQKAKLSIAADGSGPRAYANFVLSVKNPAAIRIQ
jgi:CHAT domain-containing protein